MLRVYLFLVLVVAALPTAAAAQGKSGDAHTRPPGPNGGKMEHAGANHIELVVRDSAVRVYVYDGDLKPASADGAEVSVTLQIKSQRETVKLQPAGANQMQGRSNLGAEPGLRAVVALKMPGKPVAQARFSF